MTKPLVGLHSSDGYHPKSVDDLRGLLVADHTLGRLVFAKRPNLRPGVGLIVVQNVPGSVRLIRGNEETNEPCHVSARVDRSL